MEAYSEDTLQNGSNVLVFMGKETTVTSPIAYSSSSQITYNAEAKDRVTKDTGLWKKKRVTGLSVSIKCDAFVEIGGGAYNTLLAAYKEAKPVFLQYGEKDSTGKTVTGSHEEGWFVITSIDRTDGAQEDSTFSASFENTGKIETK